ncbi:hypothetical protein NDU88_004897 [Pleurodeles waltl]|uniref:Uncharacterized protein n=1 Tax=Pleurodeles waltl TaxID=8319 RepID=A0AAV7UKJ5_PLEWA|nr:hypothetical protein NDU88_004897 [Pleurodeles waltl]
MRNSRLHTGSWRRLSAACQPEAPTNHPPLRCPLREGAAFPSTHPQTLPEYPRAETSPRHIHRRACLVPQTLSTAWWVLAACLSQGKEKSQLKCFVVAFRCAQRVNGFLMCTSRQWLSVLHCASMAFRCAQRVNGFSLSTARQWFSVEFRVTMI